jgi:hypothetical protein
MAKGHGMQMGSSGYGLAHGMGKLGSSSYHAGDTGGSHGDHAAFAKETKAFDVKAPHMRAPKEPTKGRKKKNVLGKSTSPTTPVTAGKPTTEV